MVIKPRLLHIKMIKNSKDEPRTSKIERFTGIFMSPLKAKYQFLQNFKSWNFTQGLRFFMWAQFCNKQQGVSYNLFVNFPKRKTKKTLKIGPIQCWPQPPTLLEFTIIINLYSVSYMVKWLWMYNKIVSHPKVIIIDDAETILRSKFSNEPVFVVKQNWHILFIIDGRVLIWEKIPHTIISMIFRTTLCMWNSSQGNI